METPPTNDIQAPVNLDHLLGRGDIWLGRNKQPQLHVVISSGNELLDAALLGGWPSGSLLEMCQRGPVGCEWLLLHSALLTQSSKPIFLLNPPFVPFAPALVDLGFDLDRIYLVRTKTSTEFVNAFVELARSSQCGALLAWQPKDGLTYTELRKFSLACAQGEGIYSLFRPLTAQKESSPASLRVAVGIKESNIQISIFKQRGMLESHDNHVHIALPHELDGHLPLNQLLDTDIPGLPKPRRRTFANVIPLRRR